MGLPSSRHAPTILKCRQHLSLKNPRMLRILTHQELSIQADTPVKRGHLRAAQRLPNKVKRACFGNAGQKLAASLRNRGKKSIEGHNEPLD